jgi:AraC-like DNA-binding protein
LNKAKELLPSRKNISEVAYAVGFSDRKYFSREFKKLFGINPSEYLDRADRG